MSVMRAARAAMVRGAARSYLAVADRAGRSNGQPFTQPEVMMPRAHSRAVGWTHYGVMIPDLPAPHHFLSVMSLIGATGSVAFDTDHALVDIPRRSASVVAATAASAALRPDGLTTYSIDDGFRYSGGTSGRDGHAGRGGDGPDEASGPAFSVEFADRVHLSGTHPSYWLSADLSPVGHAGEITVALHLEATDNVAWFFNSPLYRHFSLMTRYRGAITHAGETVDVAGMCSLEYGACPSPYQLRTRPLPETRKVPLDYFVYQIISIGSDEQILLSHHCIGGVPVMRSAIYRSVRPPTPTYAAVHRDCEFTVVDSGPTLTAPGGHDMTVPATMEWVVRDEDGRPWLRIDCAVDTALSFGLGSGVVGGFAYAGRLRGEEISGRGYMEYIDRRATRPDGDR